MKHLLANVIRWVAYRLHAWAERISPEERSSIGYFIGHALGAYMGKQSGWMVSPIIGGYVDPDVLRRGGVGEADEYKWGGTSSDDF